jgi:hypothetical protein
MLLASLREQISSNFNLDEIRSLCFDLDINYENLSGDTLDRKAQELVAHCNRRGRLQVLVNRCSELRPATDWNAWNYDQIQEESLEKVTRQFSHPIRQQMDVINRTVRALTEDQYEIIKWLRGQRRVAITGCAGSGKTLVAAEKAIRLDEAGIRTLILCHNPGLAEYLKELTIGTGVVVFDFSSWIYAILEERLHAESTWTVYSNYQEPLAAEIKLACDYLAARQLKFEAIIVDEAQDFREDWWSVIESALVANGILYAFHDDNQALLPNRSIPSLKEAPYSLSKNCRNAGNVFEVIKCFHQQAPEVSMFLADKGIVRQTVFDDQGERSAIEQAVQDALTLFPPHEIMVLTTEHPPISQSILKGITVREKVSWQWKTEVLKAAASVNRISRAESSSFDLEDLRYSLSDSDFPNKEDIQIVTDYFRQFVDRSYERAHRIRKKYTQVKWHLSRDGELELLTTGMGHSFQVFPGYFSSLDWADSLPPVRSTQLAEYNNHSPRKPLDMDVINFSDVPTFKGLESPAVILFVRSSRDNLSANLYVGMSRAIFYLHLITDKHLNAQFSKSVWFRRLLNFEASWPIVS